MGELGFVTALIYGTVQGITEFLPISSSAHLALLPKLLNTKDPGVLFDLGMHVGTALSIMVYFYREIIILIKELFFLVTFKKGKGSSKNYFVKNMMVSTTATVVVALSIMNLALKFGRMPELIAYNLLLFGILMYIADRRKTKKSNVQMLGSLQVRKAFWIGVFQAFAFFPGVSRSGATLTISRFMNLTREEAARYSFILGLPVIIGGFLLKSREFVESNVFDIKIASFGILISFVVGIVTIHFFLKLISKMGLWIFALYRVLLGIILLVFVI